MDVKIGKYLNWFGPYQLAEAICFWAKGKPDEYGSIEKPDWVHSFGNFLAHGFKDEEHKTWLYKLLEWVYSKRKRKAYIRIDPYDTWNMDSTLAMIILPMLIQLKKTKHGSPFVDDEDVPDRLKSINAKPKENEWDTDEFHHDRWEWVLDEMIWTFEQIQPDNDWEQLYFKKKPSNNDSGFVKFLNSFEVDREGLKKHNERIDNGLRLFGKYYRGLWD
jgi:hypothetical protein